MFVPSHGPHEEKRIKVEPSRRVFAWSHNLELIGETEEMAFRGLRSFHRAVAGVAGGNSKRVKTGLELGSERIIR